MASKITRRVALGTLLAGLAAGPFVIRALRKDRTVEKSVAFWEKQWRVALDETLLKINPLPSGDNGGGEAFRASPRVGKCYKYTMLQSEVEGTLGPDSSACSAFVRTKGSFVPMSVGGHTILDGGDLESLYVFPTDHYTGNENKKWSLLMKDNLLVPAEVSSDGISEIGFSNNRLEIYDTWAPYFSLCTDCPAMKPVVGTTWQVETLSPQVFLGRVTRTCMGRFLLDSKLAVKVRTTQELGAEEVFTRVNAYIARINGEQEKKKALAEAQGIKNMQARIVTLDDSYYDAVEGVLLHRDFTKRVHFEKNSSRWFCERLLVNVLS